MSTEANVPQKVSHDKGPRPPPPPTGRPSVPLYQHLPTPPSAFYSAALPFVGAFADYHDRCSIQKREIISAHKLNSFGIATSGAEELTRSCLLAWHTNMQMRPPTQHLRDVGLSNITSINRRHTYRNRLLASHLAFGASAKSESHDIVMSCRHPRRVQIRV